MTSHSASTPADRILQFLGSGEKTKGELLDASGCNSYTELDQILRKLTNDRKISSHWGNEGSFVYRLVSLRPIWLPKQ